MLLLKEHQNQHYCGAHLHTPPSGLPGVPGRPDRWPPQFRQKTSGLGHEEHAQIILRAAGKVAAIHAPSCARTRILQQLIVDTIVVIHTN